ncbi:MAG: flippase [Candidatus Kerfeldbacteria bacterium]|nr:flippase [Candidatus Kerfeldbacteria bacterium]
MTNDHSPQGPTSLTRSVAHNTFYQVIGRSASILLALVVFVLVARHLGVEGYGYFTTITAFLQFFGVVVDLGLYIYLAKTLGEPGIDERRIVGNVFTLRLVSAMVLLGAAPLLILAFPYPAVVKLGVAAMSISSLFVTITQVLAGLFQKTLRAGQFILGEVVGRVLMLGVTIAAIRLGAGVNGIVWTVVISSAATFLITLMMARRLTRFRLEFDWPLWRAILRTTWPIALSILFNIVYFKADTIILSLYYPATDVGIYGAPYRVFEALISIPALFAGLLTPLLAAAFVTDYARFNRILQRGFEMLLAAAVPLVVGTQFVARDVMQLVAPGFAASAPVLRILVFGTAAIFLGYLFSNTVVVVNRQRTMVWVYATMAVSSVILYWLTIPRFSYFGAASVTVLVESVVAAAGAVVVLRTSRIRLAFGPTARIMAAGLLMAGMMWLVRSLPWYVNGSIGVAIYGLALLFFRIIDRPLLKEVFGRSRP